MDAYFVDNTKRIKNVPSVIPEKLTVISAVLRFNYGTHNFPWHIIINLLFISKCQCVHLRLCSTPSKQQPIGDPDRAHRSELQCIFCASVVTSGKANSQIQSYIHWLLCYIFLSATHSLTCTSFLFSTSQMILFISLHVRSLFLSNPSLRYNRAQTTVTYKHTLKRPILMQYFPVSITSTILLVDLTIFMAISCNLFLWYSNLDI